VSKSDFAATLKTDDLNWPFSRPRLEPLYDELAAQR
jgi:hypothetical protein